MHGYPNLGHRKSHGLTGFSVTKLAPKDQCQDLPRATGSAGNGCHGRLGELLKYDVDIIY